MSQINVNTITGKDGGSAVNFPHGIIVTGVVTATSLNQTVNGNVTATSFTGPLTGTATTATGLSGTPNITVGTVTGTDATFSGNLTVNGTTTTIDTAVTAVDSLAVDGQITGLGVAGVGTASPTNAFGIDKSLHVHSSLSSGTRGSGVHLTTNASGNTTNDGVSMRLVDTDLSIDNRETGLINFLTAGTERLRIDQHGTSKFKGPLTEKCNRDTGAGLSGDYNHDLITYGNVHWATSNSASTWTYNLRGSATVALNDMMDTNESLSFQLITGQNNASNYMTAFKIDGTAHNVYWSGGSSPSEGGSGGYDVYTFTVFKIANASFRTFAALSNHA